MLSVIRWYGYSYLAMLIIKQPVHHGSIFLGPLVLESTPLNFNIFTVDRDQTVSRRSKPSSRTILTVEQTDPWKIILNQDMMSRHRGAKQLRQ